MKCHAPPKEVVGIVMKKHFLVLDSFRGICACLVAMSHFKANSIIYGIHAFDSAAIYVDFFFVLSGFVIFANYEDKIRQGYSVGKFMFLRFGRIWPLHFAVLLAFILFDLAQLFIHVGGAALYAPFSAPGETPKDIAAMIFLVHSLNVNDVLSLNGPSWSISVEFYAYLVFALVLAYGGKFYKEIIIAIGAASAIGVYILHGDLYAKLDYGFLRCLYGFGCGALVWGIYKYTHQRIESLKISERTLTWIELAVFAATALYIQFFSEKLLSMAAPIIIAFVIYLFSFEGGALSRMLKTKPFLLLGLLSYSIYMIHIFISGKLFELPVRILEDRTDIQITIIVNGAKLYGENLLYGSVMEIFYMLVVVGCSFISYKLIEEPFRNLSKKIVRKYEDRNYGTAQKNAGDTV